jgi:hypothetical protein
MDRVPTRIEALGRERGGDPRRSRLPVLIRRSLRRPSG